MPPTTHLYKFAPSTINQGADHQEQSPVIRIWSSTRLVHAQLQECTSEKTPHVHLWLVLGEAPSSAASVQWDDNADFPTLVLVFPSPATAHVQTVIDLIYALQCDGIHSVLSNAELPDLAETFAPGQPWPHTHIHTVRASSVLIRRQEQVKERLDSGWSDIAKLPKHHLCVVRACAPGSFTKDIEPLKQWLEQHTDMQHSLCWEIHDPQLKPGEFRYSLIAA